MVASTSTRSCCSSSRLESNAIVSSYPISQFHLIKLLILLLFPIICSGLETFWQSAFAWFFRPLWIAHDHLWTMEPTELAPSSTEWPWHATTYSAKIRFRCNVDASHAWTSKKGRVVFWYRMRRQGEEIICQVLFKIYGQQCNKCIHRQHTIVQQVNNTFDLV